MISTIIAVVLGALALFALFGWRTQAKYTKELSHVVLELAERDIQNQLAAMHAQRSTQPGPIPSGMMVLKPGLIGEKPDDIRS